jgi:hypothetical protein
LSGGVLESGDEAEERALLARGEGGGHHVTFAGVHRGEELVDDGLGGRGDVDEELAAILGVWLAAYQAALLEGVEQRGHRPGSDEESFGDHAGLEWLAGALDDGEDLTGAGGELVLLERLAVVQVHEQIGRAPEVGVTLGGERAGPGILILEVSTNADERFGGG